jgi:hypothetical protein
MKTFWNVVKLNLVFVLIGHLVGLQYGYTDWQLYVYVVVAILLTQMREATLFEEWK